MFYFQLIIVEGENQVLLQLLVPLRLLLFQE
jgi:hypothetical protein